MIFLGIGLSTDSILAYAIGLILLYIIGYGLLKFFKVPFKIILTILINAILGGVILVVFNFIAQYFDYTISINPFNALIVGFLGIPGLILIVIINIII